MEIPISLFFNYLPKAVFPNRWSAEAKLFFLFSSYLVNTKKNIFKNKNSIGKIIIIENNLELQNKCFDFKLES